MVGFANNLGDATMKSSCRIKALGAYSPPGILSNDDLSSMVDTSDEWIVSRTGIRRRHILAPGENNSDIAFEAARRAIDESGFAPESFTHVLTGTCTGDYLCPSVSAMIAGRLGMGPVMAFDFNAACSGFLYGLKLAQALLTGDEDARILLVCSEALSRRINWKDRNTCVLFGDGAGAAVIDGRAEAGKAALLDVICKSDGSFNQLITIGGGTLRAYEPGSAVGEDFFVHMQGQEVYRQAVRCMTASCREVLERRSLAVADVDLFVPHQANSRIIEAVGQRLGFGSDKIFMNVGDHGNTSSASVPIALVDAMAQGRIAPGTKALVVAVGGGLTWGAGLLQF